MVVVVVAVVMVVMMTMMTMITMIIIIQFFIVNDDPQQQPKANTGTAQHSTAQAQHMS